MAIERIVPGTKEWKAYYANHIVRYRFAVSQINVEGSKILDAACGVGYGSFYLAQSGAKEVVGIDRSNKALGIAKTRFNGPNVKFLNDDCQTLQHASDFGPYDNIISFETLEHLPDALVFTKAAFSLLKVGGEFVVSTPNAYVTSPDGEVDWEFHEKEYRPEELHKLLTEAGFNSIKIYGQEFSPIGRLRRQIRHELNSINSNPFMRMGRRIQEIFRNRKFDTVLPEQYEDFLFKEYGDLTDIERLGVDGPFVLVAVASK